MKIIYAGIKRISYLKPRTGFNEGITFFFGDDGYWEMLSWVREDQIDVYCECIIEKAFVL